MNDNINILYSSLQKEGFEDIGTEEQFRNYVRKPENVGILYEALAKEGYEDIGSADEFSKWLSSAPEVPGKDKTDWQGQQANYVTQPNQNLPPIALREEVVPPLKDQSEYVNPWTNSPDYNFESLRKKGKIEMTHSGDKKNGFWDTYVGDVIEKIGSGAASLGGGVFGVLDKATQGIENLGLGTRKGAFKDSSDWFKEIATSLRNKSDRYDNKNYKDLWNEGDYFGAVGDIALQDAESLPISIGAMAAAATGTPMAGLTGIGVLTASDKYDQLDEQNPNMGEFAKTSNAIITGLAEGGSEMLGGAATKAWMGTLYKTLGKEKAKEVVKKGFLRALEKHFKEFGIFYESVAEGLEEVSSQFAENVTDKITGADPERKVSDGLGDSFMYGIGGGAYFSVAGAPAYVKQRISEKRLKSTSNNIVARERQQGLSDSENIENIKRIRYAAQRNLTESETKARQLFGDDFEDLKINLEKVSAEEGDDAVAKMMQSDRFSREQKEAILDYYRKRSYHEGLMLGENKRIEEKVQAEVETIRSEANLEAGMLIEASRIDPVSGERIPGTIVQGSMGKDRVDWRGADGKVEMILKTEIDPSSVRSAPIQEVIDASIEAIRETEQERIRRDSKYNPEILSPEETLGQVFYVDGNPYIFKHENGGLKAYLVDINGQPIKAVNNVSVDDYYIAKQEEIDYEESSKKAPLYKLSDGRIARLIARDEEEVAVEILDRDGAPIDNFAIPAEIFDTEASAIESPEQNEQVETAPTADVDDYSRFVDTGEVSDEQVNGIADKILRGESLSPEEESMRAGSAQQIEDKQKEISNTINTSEIEAKNAIASPGEESNMLPNSATSEEIPASVAEENTPMAIPRNENGDLQYHLAPIDVTLADILDGTLDNNEVDAFVDENKKAARTFLKRMNEKPPKMSTNKAKYLAQKKAWSDRVAEAEQQVAYWNEVESVLKESRMKPGDKAADEIKSMGEPLTGEELAAMMLANGSIKLTKESYKRETGAGEEEAKKMFGLFASVKNGGVNIERAGELVMLADLENGTHHFDQDDPNAGRNAIIEVLSSARTRGDLINYVKNNREAMAERERQAEYDAYAEWCEEKFHMSPEDYEAYEEQMMKEVSEKYLSEEEYNDFMSILADEQKSIGNENNQGDEQTRISRIREGGREILPGEESISAERVRGTEKGSSAADGDLNSEDGTAQEGSSEDIKPIGKGPFGDIYNQFKGKAKEAIRFLLGKKNGEAIGALYHKDVGDIDLVWGKEGTGKSNGFGLSKLVKFHPEVLDDLQDIINDMEVVSRTDNRINLESKSHRAAVRLEWDGKKKNWLLTAFEKEKPTAIDRTTDIGDTELQNDTAPLQTEGLSIDKDNISSIENQTNEAKSFVAPAPKENENPLDYAERIVEAKKLYNEERKVDTNPTEAQKEAGNYKKGHIKIDGFDVTIEQPAGSVRSGRDADGKEWSVTMNNTYGYIRGTEGVDGDHIDIFLSDIPSSGNVYVVDQVNANGSFDEHKVMYGFNSMAEAKDAYLSNYSPGWKGLGTITEISKADFKKWINSSHRKTKPFAEYKNLQDKIPPGIEQALEKEDVTGTDIPVMTEEEYLASKGYGFAGIGDVALHKGKQKTGKQQDKVLENQNQKDIKYIAKREDLRKEYFSKLSKGELRQPSTIERLIKIANGNPDNEATQSARQSLKKRGIDWQENTSVRFRIVHHGTGARFDKFSTEQIGSGEGNAEFGWGLYFSEKKDIAQYYAETIGDMPSYVLYKDGKPADMSSEISRIIYNYDGDVKKAIRSIKKNAKMWEKEGDAEFAGELMKSVNLLQKEDPKVWRLKEEGNRHIYDVEIPDDGYLNWDKIVPRDQKDLIRKQADKESASFVFYGERFSAEDYFSKAGEELKGSQLYKSLEDAFGSDKEASLFLNRAGLNGIEYEAGRYFSNKKHDEMNYVIFDDNAVRIIDHLRYRNMKSPQSIDEINQKFNDELQRYQNGEMGNNEMFHLGNPEGAMKLFLPNLPIVMRQRIITKGSVKKHNVAPESLLNMPKSLSEPIFIFKREDNALGVLTEMKDRDGKNVCVAIALNKMIQDGKETLEVNDIRSIHGRNEADVIFPIVQNGTLRWVDKQKGLDWLSSASRYVQQEIGDQDLSFATKIMKSFVNPTVEEGKIVAEIDDLSNKLHTPVTIITDVNEIVDTSEKTQFRKRGSKGWYDPKTQEIVVVLPNNTSVADAQRTFLHEVVAHHGLRKLFGDDFDTFLGNVYTNANEGIRREILERTKGNPLLLREATEEYLADLAEQGFNSKEERSLWNRIKDAFIDMLRKVGIDLGFKLSDNDLRYILWRSYRNLEIDNLLDVAEDVVMRNRLGIGKSEIPNNNIVPDALYKDSPPPPTGKGKKSPKKKDSLASDEKIIKNLRERIDRMGKNSEQIEEVKKELVNEIKNRIDSKDANRINKEDLMSLLRQVRDVKTKADMAGKLMEVERISYEIKIRSTQRDIDKSLSLKTHDVNGKNMSIAKNVDDSTRRIFQHLRGKLSDLKVSGYEQEMTDLRRRNRELREFIEINKRKSLYNDLSESESQSLANEISSYEQEIEANKSQLSDLKEIADQIRNAKAEGAEADLDGMIDELKAKMSAAASGSAIWKREDSEQLTALNIIKNFLEVRKYDRAVENTLSEIEAKLRNNSHLYRNMTQRGKGVTDKGDAKEMRSRTKEIIAENKRQIVCLRKLYNEIRRSQLDVLKSTQEQLTELINDGKAALRKMTEEEMERGRSIIRNSLDDVADKPVDINNMKASEMNLLKKFFSAPLGSFDYMAQRIGRKFLNGEGYIYQYFVKGESGMLACENVYAQGRRYFRDTFEAKTREIFGKGAKSVLYASDKKIKETGVYMIDTEPGATYGQKVEKELTKGEAMYLYMVWKMNDGRMKLEKQGVDDDTMREIEDFIGPQYIKLADWIQNDLLVNLRDKYNQRYLEMYDTQMANIPSYVPLRINKNAVVEESNLEDNKRRGKSLEERTRSLINRTVNNKPVDLTTNGIGVIFEHVKEMEEWYAFARVRRDLDYILGSREFRNRVNANTHGHFSNFKDAAILASHSHLPSDPGISDTFWSKLSKGVVGGNIAFRLNTALKQIYSLPAFLGYSQSPKFMSYFAKNIGLGLTESASFGKIKGTYKWCMENMPLFYERVKEGDAGNEKLQNKGFSKGVDKYLKAGMIPNKFVDAFTVAIGAKTIYDYTYDRLINGSDKMGAEEARRLALVDADIFFNQSQQSGIDTFLSPMQRSRSMLDIAFTTYQNSNIGYVRKVMLNFYDLVKLKDWNKLRSNYVEKYISEGIEENKAYDMATSKLLNDSRKRLFGLMLFGWGMDMLWKWGSRGLMGFFAGDDDENDEYKDIVKYLTSPIRGMPIESIVSNLVEGYDINPVIFMDEVVHAWRSITTSYNDNGIDPILAIDILLSGSKLSGFDLEMWGNIYLGIEGAVRHLGREGYKMQDFLFFLNTPKSQRVKVAQEMYKDSSLLDFAEKVSRAYRYTPMSDKWEYWVPGAERMTHNKMNKIEREYREKKMTDEQKEKLKERKELEKKMRRAKDLSIDPEAMERYLERH